MRIRWKEEEEERIGNEDPSGLQRTSRRIRSLEKGEGEKRKKRIRGKIVMRSKKTKKGR
jgi:hypothetical protein